MQQQQEEIARLMWALDTEREQAREHPWELLLPRHIDVVAAQLAQRARARAAEATRAVTQPEASAGRPCTHAVGRWPLNHGCATQPSTPAVDSIG